MIAILISSPFIVYFLGEASYAEREKQQRIFLLQVEVESNGKIIKELAEDHLERIELLKKEQKDQATFEQTEKMLTDMNNKMVESYKVKLTKAEKELAELRKE